MTLLIVDDEYYLVRGIRNSVRWEDYGIDRVLEAYSAEQAMEIYREEPVDILLADVEMPRENGLSLIRRVVEAGYDSVNILLTGHAEFSYAQEALQLKVFDYLLKPIAPAQLVLIITRASEELARRRKEKNSSKQLRRELFWQLMFSGELPPNTEDVQAYLDEAGLQDISPENNYYFCYLLVRRNGASDSEISPDAAPAMQSAIRNLLTTDSCVAAADRRGYMISTIKREDVPQEELRERCRYIVRSLSENNPDHIFVLYTLSDAPLLSAPYACELLTQFAGRMVVSESRVISAMSDELTNLLQGDGKDAGLPIGTWREWLLQGRTEDILFRLRGLLEHKDTVYSARYLGQVYYGILDIVFSVLSEQKIPTGEILSRAAENPEYTRASNSPERLLGWAENLLRETENALQKEKESDTLLEQIRRFINEHLSDPDLDRAKIAAAVHISTDYMSNLFHKETGMLLSGYITEQRIASAKTLLLSTNLSLEEICGRTGFSNSPYFFRQFKKITGFTPTEYRKKFTKKT